MTIGVGSYSPSGRFAFPRSYIAGVLNYRNGFPLTQSLNEFTLDFRPTYPSVYHWTFDVDFWFWSSNAWTLDHIITECYYVNHPDPTQIPLNFGLRWSRTLSPHHPLLLFAPNNAFADPLVATFTSDVPGYWTRPT